MNTTTTNKIDPHCFYKQLLLHDSQTLKKILSINFSKSYGLCKNNLQDWKPTLFYMLRLLSNTGKMGEEKPLLTSQAFFVLFNAQYEIEFIEKFLIEIMKNESDILHLIDDKFHLVDKELFKLLILHGYLKSNHDSNNDLNNIYEYMFQIIYRNCITYTKYSYFAYKILEIWLQTSMKTNIWNNSNSVLETKLEVIIFSNWYNALNDISKQNASTIFNYYLKIMQRYYDGFVEFTLQHCLNTISWQNELKYTILVELCNVSNNMSVMKSRTFLLSLSTCLTKSYLRSSGTKVYIAILKKLNEDEWKENFGPIIMHLFNQWEVGPMKNHNALQFLYKYWLEPAFVKYKGALLYIWNLCKKSCGNFVKLYLQRIGSELNISLILEIEKIYHYISDQNEILRLNTFGILCCQSRSLLEANQTDIFIAIKSFLWYNANASTLFLRDGILKYFRIFFTEMLQVYVTKTIHKELIEELFKWIQEFVVDCFEIGSCYQRKILGLNLFKNILSFIESSMLSKSKIKWQKQSILMKNKAYQKQIDVLLKKFVNRTNLFVLLRLVLDTASDIKQLSTQIIIDCFDSSLLSDAEEKALFYVAVDYCNSSKFYEIESGTEMIKLLAAWNENPQFICEFLLNNAKSQLIAIKSDILKAIIEKQPLYGILNAILKVVYQRKTNNYFNNKIYSEKLLDILEEITSFYLCLLSSKAENSGCSSSFAEMGLAIDDAIKNSQVTDDNNIEFCLLPSHQVMISCIWMTLKISCELAAEIGSLMNLDSTVTRSINLISSVLLRCRHKGAVEAAGVSIYNLCRHLHYNESYSDLPGKYIVKLLENETIINLNVTRRGAGLTIMFHKIIISDNRRDRPLLHSSITILLKSLNKNFEIPIEQINCNFDVPCASKLHFLRSLVMDKEINAQLAPYIENISLICFKFLFSKVWVIRNASLQLFGALVPRLVGQSAGGRSLDFGNGYPVNHFVTHYPQLAKHIVIKLNKASISSEDISNNCSIAHILILLSKMSTGGCDLIDYSSNEFTLSVKKNLIILCNSSIMYIRHFAAKAYAAFTPFPFIQHEMNGIKSNLNDKNINNLRHGQLLIIKYLSEKYVNDIENMDSQPKINISKKVRDNNSMFRYQKITGIWSKSNNSYEGTSICYLLESLMSEISEFKFSPIEAALFEKNILLLDHLALKESIKPGLSSFLELSICLYSEYIKINYIITEEIIDTILDLKCASYCITFINSLKAFSPMLELVCKHLLLKLHCCEALYIDTMVKFIVNTLKISSEINYKTREALINLMDEVEHCKIENLHLSQLKHILTFLFFKNKVEVGNTLLYILYKSTDKEEHIRLLAVECMEFVFQQYLQLDHTEKLYMFYICLILLKDESEDIREIISVSLHTHLLPKFCNNSHSLHTEVLYKKIVLQIGRIIISEKKSCNTTEFMQILEKFTMITEQKSWSVIENPFDHEDDDYYKEESKLFNLLYLAITNRTTKIIINDQHEVSSEFCNIFKAKHYILQEFDNHLINLQEWLNLKSTDYLLRKKKVLINELKHINENTSLVHNFL
ncbi:tRNA (32-2'-O)-methyltransferase regulator THADA [Prorops nasuta]|uniref:tRNA (32-2'-O)-methyltransferase regulator THADA n=1 Tax=Prorops nasuta TaxID=863751 RepID=UPI0034CD2456